MEMVLSRQEMQEMDRLTISEFGIPAETLMEVAGAKCAEIIRNVIPQGLDNGVVILCGSGNNGGDGYVIARHLFEVTESILILSLGKPPIGKEARMNRERCEKLDITIVDVPDAKTWEIFKETTPSEFALVIDAVYGIGFKGKLPAFVEDVLKTFRYSSLNMVAIDIPSGADANNGTGYVYRADMTLAIEEYKYGHLLNQGPAHCGILQRVPIGIPVIYKETAPGVLQDFFISPFRREDAHKGNFGRIYVIGGSTGYTGSARLCAKAALRSGAGLVHIMSRREVICHYAAFADEVMNFQIPEDPQGMPDAEAVLDKLANADCIVIGPGMGLDAYAQNLLEIVVTNAKCPLVIDADAITLLARSPALYPKLKSDNVVLTPHPGEFCRLAAINPEQLTQDPAGEVLRLQEALGCTLLLKGHTTMCCSTDELNFIRTGNDALATGGSGDILAGIIASFIGQNLHPSIAATSASFLMGRTAEKLSEKRKSYSILPSDIIEHLGDLDE